MPHRLTLLLALCVSTAGFAQTDNVEDLRELQSARSFAMGGAYRALGMGTEAVLGNPAALALWKMYRMELHGAWDTHNHGSFGGVSVMDAKTSDLAAGLDYHLVSISHDGNRDTAHYSTLGFALPITPGVLIGTSIHYLKGNGLILANATTVDAGLLVRFNEGLTLGVSAHNLIDTHNTELARYYSAHMGYLAGLFTLAADVQGDYQSREKPVYDYHGGIECILGEAIPVRLGYSYDGFKQTSQLGVGLGFLTGEGGGIDVGYRHDLGGPKGRMLAISIKLQVG